VLQKVTWAAVHNCAAHGKNNRAPGCPNPSFNDTLEVFFAFVARRAFRTFSTFLAGPTLHTFVVFLAGRAKCAFVAWWLFRRNPKPDMWRRYCNQAQHTHKLTEIR